MIIAFIIPFFIWINASSASPLSKSIEITFVYPDETIPPIVGLSVDLWNSEPDKVGTATTDASGVATFTGLIDETYTWKWSWQGEPAEHSEEITCSKIVWDFTQTLDYWTIEKTFLYPDGTPIVGLNGAYTTDENGKVYFEVYAGPHWRIEWDWQGEHYKETVTPYIDFSTPSPVIMTNELPYWTIEKTFVYEETGLPVKDGLEVKLYTSEAMGWPITKSTVGGKVTFEDLKARSDYVLEWVWGGDTKTENVLPPNGIEFQTPTPVVLTNKLELKSGGGLNLYLPEELG